MDNLINTYEDEWANVVKGLAIKKLVKKTIYVLKIIICRPCETQTIQTIC